MWASGSGATAPITASPCGSPDGTTETSQWLCQLDFTGWKYVTAAIPAGATDVVGLAITEYDDASATSGTLYLDQPMATEGQLSDTTPPSLSVTRSNNVLTITAVDTGSGLDTVTAAIDGVSQTVQMTSGTGTVTLPGDGEAHQVRITASDQFGNLSSKTVPISGTLANPFTDLDNHWSRVYVDYCYREGILNGSADASGNLRYRPDDSMTRQEFTAAMIRFLGVDSSSYASTTLPFDDQAEIASWALNDMKAAYALGLFTGSATGGKLYANPTDTITRQEAMTILGRTQQKGYTEDDLSDFSDAASVASWARSSIAAMVTRGVITGSNGKLNPTGTVTRGQVAKMLYSLY